MTSDQAILTAATARTFSTRPSSLLGIEDPYLAYCIDETLHVRLARHEAERAGVGGSSSTSVWHDLEGMGGEPPPQEILDALPEIDPAQAELN